MRLTNNILPIVRLARLHICTLALIAVLLAFVPHTILAADVEGTAPPKSDGTVSARTVADEAAKCESAAQSIDYVLRSIPAAAAPADKRAIYAFLGGLQESLSLYNDAVRSYAAACAIAAGDAEGMQKKSNESLVLDAVRCALCAGDHATASSYLASVVNAQNGEIRAKALLYREWAALCAASSASSITAPLARLKSYSTDSAFASVRPQVLFTLWYVGGDNDAAASLKRDAPDSIEAAIVQGKARMLPVPFWYFMIRTGNKPETASSGGAGNPLPETGDKDAKQSTAEDTVAASHDAEDAPSEKVTHERIQLGLFRDKANAERLVETLKGKGFYSTITTETRASGTTYYIVIIDHPTPVMEASLRTAGFEFYPVF